MKTLFLLAVLTLGGCAGWCPPPPMMVSEPPVGVPKVCDARGWYCRPVYAYPAYGYGPSWSISYDSRGTSVYYGQ